MLILFKEKSVTSVFIIEYIIKGSIIFRETLYCFIRLFLTTIMAAMYFSPVLDYNNVAI